MYGETTNSPLQGDMPTDRFIVAWPVDETQGAPALATIPDDAPLVVGADAAELPLAEAPQVVVRVPRDIYALVRNDIASARRWRAATRRAFTHYLPRGYRVLGFLADDDGGRYLLSRTQPRSRSTASSSAKSASRWWSRSAFRPACGATVASCS